MMLAENELPLFERPAAATATERAYMFMDLFIYDENRTVTFHVQHHSDSEGHYKQQNMLGLG